MKKIISILVLSSILCIGYYCYYINSDKKLLKDFAFEVVDNSVKLNDIINKYMICDKAAKSLTLMQLEYIRVEFKKNPSNNIIVYSYKDAVKQKKIKDNIVSKDYSNVNIILFNEKLDLSVLLNSNSKIIAISTLNKGDTRFFMRIDEKIN